MKRREFLKTSIAISTVAGASTAALTSSAALFSSGAREFYELRAYRLKPGDANRALLDNYLEHAAIPAWNRLGIKPVGVFVQQERSGDPGKQEARDSNTVFVLLPSHSMESFAALPAKLSADAEYQRAGADYLNVSPDRAVFDRIDSWFMMAFAGMPRIELASYCRDRKSRMFEMRTYESYSEAKALKKIQMFNSGEIGVMREVGMAPVFYGQVLIGQNLPHLTYMLSAEDAEAHKKHWSAFGKHPVWNKLQKDPEYADTVSKITNRFLVPAPFSQI